MTWWVDQCEMCCKLVCLNTTYMFIFVVVLSALLAGSASSSLSAFQATVEGFYEKIRIQLSKSCIA